MLLRLQAVLDGMQQADEDDDLVFITRHAPHHSSVKQSINQLHCSSLVLDVSKELLDLVSSGIPVLGCF